MTTASQQQQQPSSVPNSLVLAAETHYQARTKEMIFKQSFWNLTRHVIASPHTRAVGQQHCADLRLGRAAYWVLLRQNEDGSVEDR
jgi:hypothetical protein